jgi:hypothetical protein
MHSDGDGRRGAATLLLYTLTFGLSAAVCATAKEPDASDSAERYGIDPARLDTASTESRALFAEVLDRLETLRGEVDGLTADKVALAERVRRLEDKGCETWAEEKEEKEEDNSDEGVEDQLTQRTTAMSTTNSTRRRAQASQACKHVRDFQALTVAAMDACCPMSGGGHRRMQASCDLPPTCPSAACAAVFVPYMADCAAMVAATPGVPVADFQSLAASCTEMQAGTGEMLQPVAVQMFRVLVTTEGAAQAGAMFPGSGKDNSGAGQPLDPLQPITPGPPPPPDGTGAGDETAVQQYHAVCTSADVASCVPACNAEHHGYELLATIDGTDTKFSCNLAHGLYFWMGAASEGGYLGADSASFLSAVVSGAAGTFIVTLTTDAAISTNLMIQPGQDVRISGTTSLAVAPRWGGGGFTVHERGSLALVGVALARAVSVLGGGATSLSGCTLEDSFSLTTTAGGSLSLASMAVPATVLSVAQAQLSGAGSMLRLAAVTVPEAPGVGELTGTMTVGADGSKVADPPTLFDRVPGIFAVISGPCAVSEGGRCVGRPGGYLPSEACEIAIGGGGGVLGPCGVFDTEADSVTLPDGSSHHYSDCPAGVALAAGGSVGWTSDGDTQGSVGRTSNGCDAKGLCGMPWSHFGLGGGWQICFTW